MTILFFSNIHFFIDQDQKVVCVHTPVVATIVEREIEYEQDTKIIMDGLLQNEALNGFVQHELVPLHGTIQQKLRSYITPTRP